MLFVKSNMLIIAPFYAILALYTEVRHMNELTAITSVVQEIKTLLTAARNNAAREVNKELLNTYRNIGCIIVDYEQSNEAGAQYGKRTLKELSKALTRECGKGFSVSNIQFMRRFYQTYQIQQTVSVKLTWSHYCELLSVSDTDKRGFFEYPPKGRHHRRIRPGRAVE